MITCIRPSGPHGLHQNGFEMANARANNKAKTNGNKEGEKLLQNNQEQDKGKNGTSQPKEEGDSVAKANNDMV